MAESRKLRPKEQVVYDISSGSEDELAVSSADSSFSTPNNRKKNIVDLISDQDEDDDELAEEAPTPPPRISAAGHSLRQRKDIQQSQRAQENGDRPRKKRRLLYRAPQSIKPRKPLAPSKPRTERNEIRDNISTETYRRRANFLIANKDFFLLLLPQNNHVRKLVEQNNSESADNLSIPYKVLDQQPQGLQGRLKPYQLRGLSFLVHMYTNAASAILGDEMGLGKTMQTLALLQYIKEQPQRNRSQQRPSLVVCPLSVLSSWMAEAKKWTPGLKTLRFHGPVLERNRLKRIAIGEIDHLGNETSKFRKKRNQRQALKRITGKLDLNGDELSEEGGVDLIVTTYEGFLSEQSWFKGAFVWNYIILDEGHKIKSDATLISKALQGIGAEHRLVLTGTPLQNNMQELWGLLHWLYPEVFTDRSAELFKSSFDLTKGQVNTEVMDHARRLLEILMLRRMKNSPGVDLNLPPKTDVLLYVPLTPMQRYYYLRLLTRADRGLLEQVFQGASEKESSILKEEAVEGRAEDDTAEPNAVAEWAESKKIMLDAMKREEDPTVSTSAWRKLMNILMQLRKCCNHPYTLPNAAPEPYYIGEHVVHASAKFILVDKILQELVLKQKKKILIFSGFTHMLDYCEDFLSLRGGDGEAFKYVRLDGSTARARRNLGIRLFNNENSNYRVMLISTRAGGLGINLATASDVILMDHDWNPQVMLQAESRAHRIGQTKPVTVYKLCTQGTVEEQMLGRIQKKLYLSAKVTESMRDIHTAAANQKGKAGTAKGDVEDGGDMPQLGTNELMSLVRRGAQTLVHPELDVNEMLAWDWATTLEKCKPADVHVSKATEADTSVKEEEEKQWLSKIEQVQSRVFQGQKLAKKAFSDSYSNIAQEWSRESRRVGKNTTVMVDGFAISKESMNCGDWEAVPTLAGKDPRLAEPKREKKAQIVNQDHCQECWEGGDMILCSLCPRSYHYACLDREAKGRSKAKFMFSCPQHECADCLQKTTDAGGMLYRCRCCSLAFCEDCMEWDKTELLGENLKEYEMLGFPAVTQAFYITCSRCQDALKQNHELKDAYEERVKEIEKEYAGWIQKDSEDAEAAEEEIAESSELPSLDGDSTTLDSSGIVTPKDVDSESHDLSSGSKRQRKAVSDYSATPARKQPKRKRDVEVLVD